MEHTQKYEVMRLVEHEGMCYVSMDRVEGTLLIYRVQRGDILDKSLVLSWIRQMAQQLERYHRCRMRQCYRYLNPYSVLITQEEKILLLDMQAESNAFVIRSMQKRAMRSHFVKPARQLWTETEFAEDLYGLGKTVQFLLACVATEPSFTKFEEYRLSKFIEKCLETNPKKAYQDLSHLQKDIPRGKRSHGKVIRKLRFLAALAILAAAYLLRVTLFSEQETERIKTGSLRKKIAADCVQGLGAQMEARGKEAIVPAMEMEEVRQSFQENTKEGNEKVIQDGEPLKGELLYYLATVYDREGQTEAAIRTYGDLCRSQCEEEMLRQAYYRKAELEQESGRTEQAKATCEAGLEAFPELETLQAKLKELEQELSQKKEEAEGMAGTGEAEMPEAENG